MGRERPNERRRPRNPRTSEPANPIVTREPEPVNLRTREPANRQGSFGHREALIEVLHEVWGFSDFRPLQQDAMEAVLARRDSVVVMPTGGGKSLCFQAPALVATGATGAATAAAGAAAGAVERGGERRGFALVVSPLISLMKDQVDGLRVDGVEAAYLNSTLDAGERDAVMASLREDRCRLLYVSPERLVGEGSQNFRRFLHQCAPRFVAIDEAHCISQWGHDFRPEYRQLGRLREEWPQGSLHAFTATATARVREDIEAAQGR